LWQPPRPHGQQPPERIVGPLELFYDLVVVVLIGQATRHLSGHLAWRGFGEYAAVFGLVWIAWVNGSLHHELHGRDDAPARWGEALPRRKGHVRPGHRQASLSRSRRIMLARVVQDERSVAGTLRME
jgi:hypothetical protein